MDDVITDFPPPSRFLPEDLNNFAPQAPAVPSPSLIFSAADSNKSFSPSLLIVAISSPSIHFLRHLSSKTPLGTLVLPGNKSCEIFSLNNADKLIMIVLVQFPVSPERAHEVAKLLTGSEINPHSVLILDSIQSCNFRGKLSTDEVMSFKLETNSGDSVLKGVEYYPSGSIADGLGASILSRCELKKIKGCLFVSWPDFGVAVMSNIKSMLVRDVLTGINCSTDVEFEKEYLKLSRKERFDGDMYT